MLILAFMVGGLLPVQGGFNARLAQLLDHPLQASLISFTVGTMVLAACLLLMGVGLPGVGLFRQVPWYLLTGGCMGAIFVTLVLILIPRVGVASVLMATMAGQLIVSMIFDHFGWLGNPVIPFGPARLVGGVCLILGVVLIRY